MAHALAVIFPDLKPMEGRELPTPRGGLRYRGGLHLSMDSHIEVTMEAPSPAVPNGGPFHPSVWKQATFITLRDRYGHLAQVPAGGQALIMAVD
jgi:hypothetical protein